MQLLNLHQPLTTLLLALLLMGVASAPNGPIRFRFRGPNPGLMSRPCRNRRPAHAWQSLSLWASQKHAEEPAAPGLWRDLASDVAALVVEMLDEGILGPQCRSQRGPFPAVAFRGDGGPDE